MSPPLDPSMAALVPYRDAPREARFLCLGCYRTASSMPGECPGCGVPLLDVADTSVRVQIQEEVERRLQERKWREEVPIFSATLVMTVVVMAILGALSTPLQRVLAIALFFPIQRALTRAYTRLRSGSAIATFAARRERLAGELGEDVQMTSMQVPDTALALTAGEDPSSMEMPRLLEWMGVRVDQAQRSR